MCTTARCKILTTHRHPQQTCLNHAGIIIFCDFMWMFGAIGSEFICDVLYMSSKVKFYRQPQHRTFSIHFHLCACRLHNLSSYFRWKTIYGNRNIYSFGVADTSSTIIIIIIYYTLTGNHINVSEMRVFDNDDAQENFCGK